MQRNITSLTTLLTEFISLQIEQQLHTTPRLRGGLPLVSKERKKELDKQ